MDLIRPSQGRNPLSNMPNLGLAASRHSNPLSEEKGAGSKASPPRLHPAYLHTTMATVVTGGRHA